MPRQGPGTKKTDTGQAWILTGTDFSRPARKALIQARTIAVERDLSLMILHVIDAPDLEEHARLADLPARELRDRLGRERLERLAAAAREIDDAHAATPVEIAVAWGHPFEEIVKKASEIGAVMIVLGTGGRSVDLERALFGSTAEKVLRAAPCPVLCVPAE
jgi:nucleotide-binding universal stress UspA family protein